MKVIEGNCDICNNKGILVTRFPNKEFYLKLCGECFTKYAQGKEKFFGQCDICNKFGNGIAKKVNVFSFSNQIIKAKVSENLCIDCLKKKAEKIKNKIGEHNIIKRKLILGVTQYLADKVPFSLSIGNYFCFRYNQKDKFRFGDIDKIGVKIHESFIKNHSGSYHLYYTNNMNKFGCLMIINSDGVVEIPEKEEWDEFYDEAAKAFILKLQLSE